MLDDEATTPQPPPLKRRGSRLRDLKAPSSSEEGVGGGGPTPQMPAGRRRRGARNPDRAGGEVLEGPAGKRFGILKFSATGGNGTRNCGFVLPAKGPRRQPGGGMA